MIRDVRWGMLAAAAVAALVACRLTTETPPLPDLLLSGVWGTAPIPSGSYTSLDIHAAAGRITGAGRQNILCCTTDSFTVEGTYSGFSQSFSLSIQFSKGPTATYAGHALGADSLVGTWSGGEPASTYGLTFYRQP